MPRKQRPPKDRNRDFSVTLNGTISEYHDAPGRPFIRSTVTEARSASLTVINPYRPVKPKGLWPPTDRTLAYEKRIQGNGTYRYVNQAGVALYVIGVANGLNDLINAMPVFPAGLDNRLRTEAIFEAMTKVKDQQWNAGVMLAEANGVARMVEDLASLILRTRRYLRGGEFAKAYREFRRSTRYMSYPAWKRRYHDHLLKQARGRKALKSKREIPTSWLYYHFGIKPTLNDVSAAISQIGMGAVNSPYDFGGVVRGYAKEALRETRSNTNSTYGRAGTMEYNYLRSVRVSIPVRPKQSFLNRLSKFGVTNIADAAWNWAPYSWAADYFSTFGQWVNLLDTGLGWQFGEKWTESFRLVRDCKLTYQPRKRYFPIGMKPAVYKTKYINRVVRGDMYGPMGSVLPTWKRKGPSAQMISNLASAIALAFSKGGKIPRI